MASKNIGDYLGAKGDNPTQAIIDDLFLNKGSSVKRKLRGSLPAETYLARLGRFRELLGMAPIDRPSHLIRETDPYQIFRRYNKFERLSAGSQEFLDLGKSLGKEAEAALSFLGREVPELEILRLKNKSEIYIGNAGIGYTPLPVQSQGTGLESGLVRLGRRTSGAYRLGIIDAKQNLVEKTISDVFYGNLHQEVSSTSRGLLGKNLNKTSPLIIFDLETTGKEAVPGRLSVGSDQEILQLYARKIEGNKVTNLSLYFTPEGEIHYTGHGLTKESLAKKGATAFKEKAKEIESFFKGANLAGYNISGFDIPVLQANLQKAGINIDLSSQGIIDVYHLHKAANPRAPGSLGEAFQYYTKKILKNAHNAAVDVAATVTVLRNILGTLGTKYQQGLALLGSEGISEGASVLAQTLGGSFRSQATLQSIKRLKDIKVGIGSTGASVSLSQLLATPEKIRGMSESALGAMYKGQQLLIVEEFLGRTGKKGEEFISDLFKRKREFTDARRAISQIIKSRGLSVPDNIPFLNALRVGKLGELPSASVALRKAYQVVKEYNEFLPNAFAKFGLAGLHPLIKADTLVEALDNIILPSKHLRNIFGGEFSERLQTKGYHQVYKASPITQSVARKIKKAGARPFPYFMTEGELRSGIPTGSNILATRRPYTVLSLKLRGSHAYRTVFEDSGMLMTTTGLEASSSRQFLDTIKIKGANGKVLRAYETLTGGSAFDENLRLLQISEHEFDNVVKYLDAPKKLRNKILTRREKALRTLMYAPTRDVATGKIIMAPRQDFGVFKLLAKGQLPGSELARYHRAAGVLASAKYASGTLSLRLQSIAEMAAGSAGFVLGGIRLTGVAVRRGNVVGGLLHQLVNNNVKGAKNLGVEAVVGSPDIQKIDKFDRFLDNFHATLYRHGIASEYKHLLGTTNIGTLGNEIFTAAVATSKKEALIQAGKVIKHLKSRGGRYLEIAKEATKGINVTPVVQQILGGTILKDLVEDARIISISGFKRADQRLDTNLRNRLKITLGKFKTAALGSGLLGYESAIEDPLVRDLAFQFKMFAWDHTKKDFVLADKHPIKQFLKGLAEPGAVKPLESQIITIGQNGELLLGGKSIKKLPDIKQFTTKAGGVSRAEIKGTLLDPDLGDFFYLDLGSRKKLQLLGRGADKEAKAILGNLEHRYIPIPRALLRTEQSTDARIILGRKSVGYSVVKLLNSFSSGETESGIKSNIQRAVQAIYNKLGGKKGLMAKMHTIHLATGYRARLVPQQTTIHDILSMGTSRRIFEGAVSRDQLIAALERREGFFLGANATKESKAEYAELLRQAKNEKYIYSMFMADPTQRAEHMGVFRFNIIDTPLTAADTIRIAELGLDVQMHTHAFKLFERDVDNDAISFSLLSGNRKAYRNRLARQAKAMEPVLQFFKDAAAAAKTTAEQTVVADIFAAFTGQKSFASLGYSAVRPTVERLIPALAQAGSTYELAKRGIKVEISQAQLKEMQGILGAGTKFFEQKYAASFALSQYLFQAGVKKGTSKVGQEQLNIGLIELGEETAAKGLNVVRSIERASDLFYDFIKGQDTNRIFQAGFILNRTSTPKVLEGLLKGAQQGSEEYLLRKASIMMAQTIGLGFALGPKLGNFGTVAGFAEDENIFYSQKSLFKRVFGPLIGIFSGPEEKVLSSGVADAANPADAAARVKKATIPGASTFAERMSSLKSDMFKGLRAFAESKFFVPTLIGTAALASVGVINRLTAPDLSIASLPPPSDTSRPTDMGPPIPNMKAPPRINSSNFTPSASTFRHNQKFGSVNSNFFDNRVNNRVIIEDKTSSRNNSWLIRRQMDMESESDFAY